MISTTCQRIADPLFTRKRKAGINSPQCSQTNSTPDGTFRDPPEGSTEFLPNVLVAFVSMIIGAFMLVTNAPRSACANRPERKAEPDLHRPVAAGFTSTLNFPPHRRTIAPQHDSY